MTKNLEEDTLRNGTILSKDFERIISILQEETVCFKADDLHRFLANFWSLPGLLNATQRKRMCDTIVHVQLQFITKRSALVLADAVDMLAEEKEIGGYLDELGKTGEMADAC